MAEITKEEVLKLVTYDPKTGVFTWLYRSAARIPDSHARGAWNERYAGKEAGYIDKGNGFRRIKLEDKQFYARRLAFLIMTGEWPKGKITNIDGDYDNNAWANLTTDKQAKPARPKKGVAAKGVVYSAYEGKYMAFYHLGFVMVFVGLYRSAREAINARASALEAIQ